MADNKQSCISYCFFVLFIVIIVYTRSIYDNTKNNPLEKPLNENRTVYFKNNRTIFSPMYYYEKQCICGDEILNDFCTEEQLLSGCHDKSLNKQFLRFLMDETECKAYELKIMDNKTKSLSEIFDINAGKINDIALGIMILTIISMCLIFLLSIFPCFFLKCEDTLESIANVVACLNIIISLLSFIINLILFIILCVQYNKGDTADYVDFLDCKNVEKKSFKEFEEVEDLKSNYKSFLIVNIIYYVLSGIYIVWAIFFSHKDDGDY